MSDERRPVLPYILVLAAGVGAIASILGAGLAAYELGSPDESLTGDLIPEEDEKLALVGGFAGLAVAVAVIMSVQFHSGKGR